MELHSVLLKPLMTEKTSKRHGDNMIAMKVQLTATKPQIKAAIEALYGTKVRSIRTMVVHGKVRRKRTSIGRLPNWKKAIVTLQPGQSIDFFAIGEE